MTLRPVLVLLALAGAALAGCLGAADHADGPLPESGGRNDHLMSGSAVSREAEFRRDGRHVVENVTTVTGALRLDRLDVTLRTVSGDVTVRPGVEGEWRLVVTRTASGRTAEEARENFDRMVFFWVHEQDGEHLVHAEVRERRVIGHSAGSRVANLALEVPPSLLMALTAGTVNGDSRAESVRASRLSMQSVNGDVVAQASDVAQADLETVNGDVDAAIRPGASGTVTASTVNGDARVRVPEAPSFGYDADLGTVNGEAEVGLSDGTREGKPGARTAGFRTSGFDARDVRVRLSLNGVNGDVTLGRL